MCRCRTLDPRLSPERVSIVKLLVGFGELVFLRGIVFILSGRDDLGIAFLAILGWHLKTTYKLGEVAGHTGV